MVDLPRFITHNKKSILLFLTVGSLSAIVNLGSFTVLWKYMGVNYQVAVSVAYVLSVIFHFTANRNITFKSHRSHYLKQVPRYLTMILVNYLITLAVTHFVVEILHLTPYIGIIMAIGITVNTSYFMSRYWVFHTTVKNS
jgi:putative flippase GtrA